MLTVLFIVGRTTLFTPVDINLQQVVDFSIFTCVNSENINYSYHMMLYIYIYTVQ
jgi:hypothetical protein